MSDSQLLYQVRQEFQTGDDYMSPKRTQILNRLEKHIKQNKQPGLLNINMVSNTIDTLIAGSYIDEPQVNFVSKDNLLETEQADTLNYMYKFDTKEQDYQQLDYQVQRDRYFTGLGIAFKHGMDLVKMSPIFYAVNPLTAIFDPTPTLIGKFNANQYKFFGFRMTESMFNLKNDPQYDKAMLGKLTRHSIDNDKELFKQATSISDNTNYICDNLLLNYSVDIYHHFTIYDGKKWLITTDADRKFIIRKEEIKATLEEEKENPVLIPRPFAFYFYKPERGKVLGVSVPDLLDDKEEAKTILMNASLIKAQLEAFGGKYVVNSRYIKSKADVLKPTTGPKMIFTNDKFPIDGQLGNVMQELPTSNIKQDVLSMSNMIEREATMDTKQDQMQMGIVPDKTMTKAEQQSTQLNANVLASLNMKTYLWGAHDFAFLRWRTYQEYFSQSDEKFILMNQDFEWKSISVKRDKFKTKNNPFIVTGSKADLEAMKEKQKAYWNATLPIIMNDPDIPQVSKLIAKRFTAKLNGMPQNSINQIYSLTATERKAINYIEDFINDDKMPKTLFDNPKDDYMTYYIYFQKADNNDTKEKILAILNKYLMEQGQETQMLAAMQPSNPTANSAANILTSQLGQQQGGSEIASKQDVLSPNAA